MVAKARDFDIVFLGGLEDGEVVIYLVGFVVDEDLYLFGRKWSVRHEVPAYQRRP